MEEVKPLLINQTKKAVGISAPYTMYFCPEFELENV